MTEVLTRCRLSIWERLAIDKGVEEFHAIAGACERIFNTPIPVALTRMTSCILILWHLGLPYGLWSFCGWLTVPVTSLTATGSFYIEDVGLMIEEPFWVLALLALCNAIKAAVEGLEVAHKGASALCDGLDGGTAHPQQQAAHRDHETVVATRLPCRHNIAIVDDQVVVSSLQSEAVASNSVESISSLSDWGSLLPQCSSPWV